jgi:hypothetical protein
LSFGSLVNRLIIAISNHNGSPFRPNLGVLFLSATCRDHVVLKTNRSTVGNEAQRKQGTRTSTNSISESEIACLEGPGSSDAFFTFDTGRSPCVCGSYCAGLARNETQEACRLTFQSSDNGKAEIGALSSSSPSSPIPGGHPFDFSQQVCRRQRQHLPTA